MCITIRIGRSNCTGTGNSFRRTWMERKKKEHRLLLRTECGDLLLRRSRRDFAFITRTITPGWICMLGSTAGRSEPFTSNLSMSRGGDMAMDCLAAADEVKA